MTFIPYLSSLLAASLLVRAQLPTPAPVPLVARAPQALPLTDYTYTYPNVPEQVNPYPTGRGPQFGYNICNSTTEGPNSLCQTMFVNTIADFCLWGSATPNGVIGNVEAAVVAYCSQTGHGTRIMPQGTLTAVQFIKTPGYIQVTGLFNQVGIDLNPTDAGGELDPHGADLQGNPLGGLVFSNNLPSSKNNSTYVQVNNWSNFVGSGQFCIKACDNSIKSPDYCQNIYDTVGCADNMPAAYAPGVFLSCLGDNQAPPNGGPIPIPATSQCTTYHSTDLYTYTQSAVSGFSTSTSAATTTGTGTGTHASSTSKGTPSATAHSGAASISVPRSGSSGFFAVALTILTSLVAFVAVL